MVAAVLTFENKVIMVSLVLWMNSTLINGGYIFSCVGNWCICAFGFTTAKRIHYALSRNVITCGREYWKG